MSVTQAIIILNSNGCVLKVMGTDYQIIDKADQKSWMFASEEAFLKFVEGYFVGRK